MYYKQLFDDTQQSAYNFWKHLGSMINLNKKKRGSNINNYYITENSLKAHGKYVLL